MVRMKTVRPGTKKAMEHEPFHPSPIFSGVIIDCLPASTRDAPKGSAATGDLTGIHRSEYRLSAMRSARSGKSSVFPFLSIISLVFEEVSAQIFQAGRNRYSERPAAVPSNPAVGL